MTVSHKIIFVFLVLLFGLLNSCGVKKATMSPQLSPLKAIENPKMIQLSKVVCNVPRGTEIGELRVGAFCVPDSPITWRRGVTEMDLEDFEPPLRKAFEEAGYKVAGDPNALFEDSSKWQVDYNIGALIKKLELNICSYIGGGEGEGYIEVEWQIYNTLTRSVIHTFKSSGSSGHVNTGESDAFEPLRLAFGNAARNLLAEKEFYDLLASGSISEQTQDSSLVIDILRKAPAAATEQSPLSLARLATLTIFAANQHGSGFVISEDGYVLTNQHVVGNAKVISAKTLTGRELVGEVIRTHRERDVALIKLEEDKYQPLPVGNSSMVEPGTEVYAIGSPFLEKFGQSLTRGIISGFRTEDHQRYIQSDVSVHPGNSGGPLLTADGKAIGMAVKSFLSAEGTGLGINLFIPIEEALSALNIQESTGN